MAGQFASADTVQDGLNRYGYVAGNPTTATDPSGHRRMCEEDCGTPPPLKKTPPPPPPKPKPTGDGVCHSDSTCGCYTLCSESNGNSGGAGDCDPALGGGGTAGGFTLLFSCKEYDHDPNLDSIKPEWGASYNEQYTLWLSGIESDPNIGLHVNLHVRYFLSDYDQFNFHITYWGKDGLSRIWIWQNLVPGVIKEEEQQVFVPPLILPLEIAANIATDEMLRAFQDKMGVNWLWAINDYRNGRSLHEALANALESLAASSDDP